jgi:hypothetical protein
VPKLSQNSYFVEKFRAKMVIFYIQWPHISLNIPPIINFRPLKMFPVSRPIKWYHCHPVTATLSKVTTTNAAKIAIFQKKKFKKIKKKKLKIKKGPNSLNTASIPYFSPLKMLSSSFPVDPAHCHPATATLSKDTPHSRSAAF